MKSKPLNKHFLFFIGAIIIFFISLFASNNNTNKKGVTSIFLNSSDLIMDFQVEIYNNDKKLQLTKVDSYWFASLYDSLTMDLISCTLADSQRSNSFVEKLISNHRLYKISDNKDSFSELNLADSSKDSFVVCVLRSSDVKPLACIQFGKESASAGSIFLRDHINDPEIAWEMKNDLSTYLSIDLNLWANGEIFAEAKNKSSLENTSELLKFRHGSISGEKISSERKFDKVVSLKNVDERTVIAYFYKNGDDYLCKKVIVPAKNDSSKLKSFFKEEEETVYELSSWTFESIIASENKIKL